MSKTETAIVIAWYGPYTFEEASCCAEQGLYMVYGRRGKSVLKNKKVLYCGITTRDVGTRVAEHVADVYNHRDNRWWVGEQIFPKKRSRSVLEDAEWVLTRFTNAKYAKSKTKGLPKKTIYLINTWYKTDEETLRVRNRNIMKAVPHVICWSPDEEVLRTGNLKVRGV